LNIGLIALFLFALNKGAMTLSYLKLSLFMAAFILFAIQACSQDDNAISGVGGYLDTGDNSARQDIIAAFGEEDLFNPGKSKSGSSIGTGKKAPVAVTRDMLPSASRASASDVTHSPASIAGRWSLVLTDSMARSVNLMIAQSDDAIFGRGYMIYGNTTQDVVAVGSVYGTEIGLDLLALKDMNLYRLVLGLEDNLLSGEYMAYSASIAPWSGGVDGNIA
jgi:hypothetical protein